MCARCLLIITFEFADYYASIGSISFVRKNALEDIRYLI